LRGARLNLAVTVFGRDLLAIGKILAAVIAEKAGGIIEAAALRAVSTAIRPVGLL
jgi:uncharacterized protein (DUF697 family)